MGAQLPWVKTYKKIRFTLFIIGFVGISICFSPWQLRNEPRRYLKAVAELDGFMEKAEGGYDFKKEAFHMEVTRQFVNLYSRYNNKAAIKRNPHGRKYLVGSYSCPHQAGNRLHKFFNDYMMAMITNRTFLWAHCSKGYCTGQARRLDGTWEDCQKFMQINPSIPEYNKTLHGSISPVKVGWPLNSQLETQIDLATEPVIRLERYDKWQMPIAGVLAGDDGASILSERAHARARRLFQSGSFHAYGMVWKKLFQFSQAVQPSPEITQELSNNQAVTVAIHSRHQAIRFGDGTDIEPELNCLRQLLPYAKAMWSSGYNSAEDHSTEAENRECIVVVMSDRLEAEKNLVEKIPIELGCKVVTTEHNGIKPTSNREHGECPGGDFIRELALASRVTGGVCITKGSTGSDLLAHKVEGGRFWENKDLAPHSAAPMPVCEFHPTQKKSSKCYPSTVLVSPALGVRGRRP